MDGDMPSLCMMQRLGTDSSFGKKICHQCHTLVKAKDFIFHELPQKVNGHEACRACHGRPRTEFTYDITGTGS